MITNDFPAADKTAWLRQVQQELPADQSPNSLRQTQPDGFVTEPYYTADDLTDLPLDAQQAAQRQTPGWLNTPAFAVTNAATDNAALRRATAAGADALLLALPAKTDLPRLLAGIKGSDTPVFFDPAPDATLTETTAFFAALRQVAPYQLRGGFVTNQPDHIAEALRHTSDSPRFRAVCADARPFHNAGATPGQELALLLAQLTDHYDHLTEAGFAINDLIIKTMVMVSVGTDYFTEIAKLRALRVLWQRLVGHYSGPTSHSSLFTGTPDRLHSSLFIHAQTSTFYDAAVTPYTNLLRATTEGMSAVMGGCDALTVLPYDRLTSQPPGELGERLARNVSLLLRDESQLGRVADPGAGSYAIETLTHRLVETAWTLFLQIETLGGLTNAMTSGFVPDLLDTAYRAKVQAVEQGRVLVGVTRFRHDEPDFVPMAPIETGPAVLPAGTLPERRLTGAFGG